MNKKFLYTKPSIIGVLDSGNDSFNDIGSWLFDDSPDLLRKKFREDSLDELVKEIIEIFREGNPNYQELASLFGMVKIEEVEQKGIKVWNLRNIERLTDDLTKIEMHIDAQRLIINKLYLYINELHNFRIIKNMLNINFKDIYYQDVNDGLVFVEKETTITIIKGPDE
ncbi:hypothetical protein QD46_18190 [Paenibacillus polymyxa]|uniref:hypothetical protein n=1 Tax=Paenibacillus polymyxa TaxID=1406 RepID=UPI0005CEFFC9|nr:hypothetical protein [Paenibacillus polymyxa]KJD38594.1 hypothetical protein QD46_18190 [Paenibacillus polymyxa]